MLQIYVRRARSRFQASGPGGTTIRPWSVGTHSWLDGTSCRDTEKKFRLYLPILPSLFKMHNIILVS